MMINHIKKHFNPLLFLASLGAGGIAVSAFILIQYGGIFDGQGLATMADITQTPLVVILEVIMVVFALLHAYLTIIFFVGFASWKKTEGYKTFKNNPLVHSGLMAPYLSVAMSMNVVIAVVRYFSEPLSSNFQAMMLPAFIFYVVLWVLTVSKILTLLKIVFVTSFDVEKIHFGWLLQPFALAMVMVTGSGFAALAHNTATITYNDSIAGFAAFLSLISLTMVVFLTSVKMFSIFKKHLERDGALDHQFMPTYLILVPILTLLGITVFRLGHYAENFFHAPISFILAKIILLGLYTFLLWHFAFGLMMLRDYWKEYFTRKFHVSQWGLICPFVALAALSGFVYKIYFQSPVFFVLIFALLIFTAGLYLFLLKRQWMCLMHSTHRICDK